MCTGLMVGVIAVPPAAALFGSVPLTALQWAVCAALSLLPLLLVEAEKRLFSLGRADKKR